MITTFRRKVLNIKNICNPKAFRDMLTKQNDLILLKNFKDLYIYNFIYL